MFEVRGGERKTGFYREDLKKSHSVVWGILKPEGKGSMIFFLKK